MSETYLEEVLRGPKVVILQEIFDQNVWTAVVVFKILVRDEMVGFMPPVQ
jgi:hypothetical protein